MKWPMSLFLALSMVSANPVGTAHPIMGCCQPPQISRDMEPEKKKSKGLGGFRGCLPQPVTLAVSKPHRKMALHAPSQSPGLLCPWP